MIGECFQAFGGHLGHRQGHLGHRQGVVMVWFLCHVYRGIEQVAGGATQAFWSKRCTICAAICIHTHKWWLKGREPYGFTCIQGEKVKVSFHMLISSECEWQRTSCVSLRLCLHWCAALCCTAAPTQAPGRKQTSLHKCVLRLTAPVFRQARWIHSTFSLQICPVLFTHCSPTPLHYLFHFSRTSWSMIFSCCCLANQTL